MTITQKFSWINEKVSDLIQENRALKNQQSALEEGVVKEAEKLKVELEQWKKHLKTKEEEIKDLKIKLKDRDGKIHDVARKMELLMSLD